MRNDPRQGSQSHNQHLQSLHITLYRRLPHALHYEHTPSSWALRRLRETSSTSLRCPHRPQAVSLDFHEATVS